MFERFTDKARRVTVLASEEARVLNHNYIGTEHLLEAILHDEDSAATEALVGCGVTLEAARAKIEEIIGHGQQSPSGYIPFTPRAKKVLEMSLREALQLNSAYISPEHILLAIIREGDGVGAQVIKKLSQKSLKDMWTAVFQAIAYRTAAAAAAERDAEAGSGADDTVEGPEYPLPYVIQPVVVDIHRAVELSVDAAVSAVQRAIERGDTRPPEVLYHRAFEVITTHFKRWADEAVARTT